MAPESHAGGSVNQYDLGRYDTRTVLGSFELWRRSEYLVGINTQFGGRLESQLVGRPLIRWEPAADSYRQVGRAETQIQPRGPGETNQLCTVRSKNLRDAGVTLVIFGETDDEAEEAIASAILACEHTFGASANCRVLSGSWKLARAYSTACERYELRIVLALPIVRILPAANTESVNTTPILEVP